MSAIPYRDFDLRRATALEPRARPTPGRHGLIRRVFAAVERSLARQTEREAGRFIANHGGRLTDDIERQLAQQFSGRGFLPYPPPRGFRSSANLLSR